MAGRTKFAACAAGHAFARFHGHSDAERGSSVCISEEDCNLNGHCIGRLCKCVPEWTGDTCGKLNLHPARPSPLAGYDEPGVSSWGGSIIVGDDGLHHMFLSRMVNGTGLSQWGRTSEIVHATALDPEGPYTFNETILDAFAHGPSVRSLGAGQGYMLMHLGCGRPMDVPGEDRCSQGNVSIKTSPSLWGPWSDSQQVFLSSGASQVRWWQQHSFTNPAPWVLADGSIACAFRATNRTDRSMEHVSIAFAESPSGSYVDEREEPVVTQWSEDPFLWQDERGHWHMLLHTLGKPRDGDFVDAAHAFSREKSGPWTVSAVAPYTQTVQFSDGTSKLLFRRERPQLLLSPTGQPRLFSSGVQVEGDPDRTYTLVMRVKAENSSVLI